jgi:hypothetical protein
MKTVKMRVFRGNKTKRNGADPDRYYFEPQDHKGDKLFSDVSFESRSEAIAAAALTGENVEVDSV